MAQHDLPPLDVIGPCGDRITVSSLRRETTVAELAASLSVSSIAVEGAILEPEQPIHSIGSIRRGSHLTSAPAPHQVTDDRIGDVDSSVNGGDDGEPGFRAAPDPVEIAVVVGPACSVTCRLPAGRHIVGRSTSADISIDDPAMELHHAVLDVDVGGGIVFTQLAGAVPALVDGEPIVSGALLEPGVRVSLGASIVEFSMFRDPALVHAPQPSGSVAPHVTDPWRRVVWRAPVEAAEWTPPAVALPMRTDEPAGPPVTALVGAATAAMGAGVIATVMDNLMFLVFAGVGAVTALTTWCVSATVAWRRRLRARADSRREIERFRSDLDSLAVVRREHHERSSPSLRRVLEIGLGLSGDVWSRRRSVAGGRTGRAEGRTDRDVRDGRTDRDVMGGATDLQVIVGEGTARWVPSVGGVDGVDAVAGNAELVAAVERISRIERTPIPLTIGFGDAIALHGPIETGRAVARSIIGQLATLTGPADWRLLVLTDHPDQWDWANWLPHGALDGSAVMALDGPDRLAVELNALRASERLVVVTDDPALFTTRTGPLRRMLAASGASSIVIVETDATVPALCGRVLHIGATGRACWIGDTPASDDATDVKVAGITVELADRLARRLACLVDPEDGDGDGSGLPGSVCFDDVTRGVAPAVSQLTPDDIVEAWNDGGADPAPRAPIGWSSDGLVEVDLVRDGPHGLIAGTTGSGKSELLRSLVLSLALHVSPEHLNVVLVDYKGGSTFDECVDLPHTVGLVTDLDDGLAERALLSLTAELHRRERMLRSVGASDLTDYRSRGDVESIARLVVVIDEFAALAKELPEFLAALVDIAQRGRSLGVHLLLATQRPAGVVNDDIRANTNLRLALRLNDRADAVDVVNDTMPAGFPRGIPGRSALRLGPEELVVFQAARCTGLVRREGAGGPSVRRFAGSSIDSTAAPTMLAESMVAESGQSETIVVGEDVSTELQVTVECIVTAAREAGTAPAHRPWLDPLPFPIVSSDLLAPGVISPIGLVDDPEHQCRLPLTWEPQGGSLALIGSTGSGTTSTLISLAAAACRSVNPTALHLYVVDAGGDDCLGALASLAHCGGVVRVTEHERLHRLFLRLVDIVDRRLAGTVEANDAGVNGPDTVVLMIDGWSTLRAAVSHVERTELNELVTRVLADGPGVGVVAVIADGGSPAALSLAVSDRWVFHLDDPAVSRSFGVRVPVGNGRPGRLRLASTGLEAQVAVGAAGLAEIVSRDVDRSGPGVIAKLPEHVMATFDEHTWTSTGENDSMRLVVGLGSERLEPDGPRVPRGDSILVVGAARTGVSTTIERCAAGWRQVHGDHIVNVDRRQPIDIAALVESEVPLLLVIDDAHRIDDDAAGTLSAIARGEQPHVTLLAGARADGVRSGYGHWTREVAKARCGIVMANRGDPDGDILGVNIPRRPLVGARPGLGWIVDDGPLRQIQMARAHAKASSF